MDRNRVEKITNLFALLLFHGCLYLMDRTLGYAIAYLTDFMAIAMDIGTEFTYLENMK